MHLTRRSLLAGAASLAVIPAANAQPDGLGFEWAVHEEVPGGRFWSGTWRRRGFSTIFDARWRDSQTGGLVRDVIEIRGITGSTVTLFRHGNGGTYVGEIGPGGRRIRGTASWYPPGAFWSARIRG